MATVIAPDETTRLLEPDPVATVQGLVPASWGMKTAVVVRPLVVIATTFASLSCIANEDGIVPEPQVIRAVSRWYCVALELKTTDDGTAALAAGPVKLADTDRFTDMRTVQEPVPEHAPPQPLKIWPAAGFAVSLTLVPDAYDARQVLPQLIPLPLTVPLPLFDTVSVLFAACAGHETNRVSRTNEPQATRASLGEIKRRKVGDGVFKRTPRGAAVNAAIWISLAGGAAGIGCNGVAGLQ